MSDARPGRGSRVPGERQVLAARTWAVARWSLTVRQVLFAAAIWPALLITDVSGEVISDFMLALVPPMIVVLLSFAVLDPAGEHEVDVGRPAPAAESRRRHTAMLVVVLAVCVALNRVVDADEHPILASGVGPVAGMVAIALFAIYDAVRRQPSA